MLSFKSQCSTNMIGFKWCLIFVSLWISKSVAKSVYTKPDNFMNVLSKSWKHCMNAPTLNLCFKQRSLLSLDHLIKSNDPINFPGEMVSLVKINQNAESSTKHLTENDLDKNLPKDIKLQEKTLDVLLESAYSKFLSSRSIQIKFPQTTRRSKDVEESRGDKKKGGNGLATGALLAACTMIPMALAGIGALAGKALMTSMLALMMSALLASRKSHDGGGGSSYEVISIPAGGGHHHHGRNLPTADELAYEAHSSR